MNVSYLLHKENNNLNLIRLILASLVIVAHSPLLNGKSGYWVDPVGYFFPFTSSGILAVNMFFFISGLVVTNSLLANKKPVQFIIARLFRIIPAFLFVILVTVFLIGPLVTNIPLKEYFNNAAIFAYIKENLLFNVYYLLPGVFMTNFYPAAVNGSFWTLAYEMNCYIALLGTYLIVRNKRKLIYNIVIAIIILEGLFQNKILFNWLGSNPEINLLPSAFAFGCFFAVNADEIKLDIYSVLGMFLLYYFFRTSAYAGMLFNLATGVCVLFISSNPVFNRFKPKYDISFGVYLWGFVVQQTLYRFSGHIYVGLHCFIALVISLALALPTHFLIERPGIRIGRKIYPNEPALL